MTSTTELKSKTQSNTSQAFDYGDTCDTLVTCETIDNNESGRAGSNNSETSGSNNSDTSGMTVKYLVVMTVKHLVGMTMKHLLIVIVEHLLVVTVEYLVVMTMLRFVLLLLPIMAVTQSWLKTVPTMANTIYRLTTTIFPMTISHHRISTIALAASQQAVIIFASASPTSLKR